MEPLANISQLDQFLDFLTHIGQDSRTLARDNLYNLQGRSRPYAPDARIAAEILLHVMDQAITLTGRPDLMLAFVDWLDPGRLGLMGLLGDHCSSLAQRCAIEQRYLYLENSSVLLDYRSAPADADIVEIRIDVQPHLQKSAGPFLLALTALHLKVDRLLLGENWAPVAMLVPQDLDPALRRSCGRHLRCPIRPCTQGFGLHIQKADFERQVRPSNPVLLGFIEEHLQAAAANWPQDLPALVSSLIHIELRHRLPTLPDLAARLAVTPRTLQRRLQACGHSYGDILHQLRTRLAQAAFIKAAPNRPPLSRLASDLGYGDVSTACRFIRRLEREGLLERPAP